MILNIKKNKPSAKIANGTLILSLPNAITPALWRVDLGHIAQSSIEVQEKAGEGESSSTVYQLVFSNEKNEVKTIAGFHGKDEAMQALMMVTKALSSGGGLLPRRDPHAHNESTGGRYAAPYPKRSMWKWAIFLILGLALGFLIKLNYDWNARGLQTGNVARAPAVTSGGNTQSPNQAGVPQSADEFLRAR